MPFTAEQAPFVQELEAHYGAGPADLSAVERELHALSAAHPEWLPYQRKAAGYPLLAERCPVHLFRRCPFYFEFDNGRPRHDLGTGGIGGWLKREPFGVALVESSVQWLRPCSASGLTIGWAVLDDNHHAVGYDTLFRVGLRGLARQAEARLATASTDKEREFLRAAMAGHRALMGVGERFAAEARRLLADEREPVVRARFERIAATAGRVPAEPPQTFYEALNTLLFVFYTFQAIEGNGISVFGHVDRILWPFYERDRAAGRLTEAEARDLLGCFLAISDARYGMTHPDPNHVGTNGTVGIGGCDQDGTPVFNDLTRFILEAHRELGLVDPKINARVSARHPRAYLDLLADFLARGGNSLAVFNDDVIIPANVRMGKSERDCRLYVGGGCQENVLENTEVNSRATLYLNLLQVFLMGFDPGRWQTLARSAGFALRAYSATDGYEAFRATFLENLHSVVNAHVAERNRTEREGWRYNPCPLHSSTLDDCLKRALDMMEGGARYSFGSVALTGIGTLVDSLFAVRHAVFEQHQVSLAQLADMLAHDFAGEEAYRQYLLHRLPKFGHDDAAVRTFSAQLFADVARVSSGQPNSRGGRYEASLFPFRLFIHFGQQTGATPDGRKAGEPLSPGMGPSYQALGPKCSIGQVLTSLEPLDLTQFPVVAVLDVKLPGRGKGSQGGAYLTPVLLRFLQVGGSVLQVNCVDQQLLEDAREHPERHPDLVVRVSGYSSYFTVLSDAIQDEIISRTEAL